MSTPRDLILFDIDGTLLRTEGAGRASLDAAFLRLCGWNGAMDGIDLAGATDGWILQQVRQRWGAFPEDRLQALYLEELSGRIAGRASALPGVHRAVAALGERAHVGLLTGNWREGARIKLSAIDLWWEGPSAFGDDAVDRNHLVPVARRRAQEWGYQPRRVVVIGDTPKDVECARAGDAIAVAVKTGFATVESLEQSRPDLLLADLEGGLDALLELLG